MHTVGGQPAAVKDSGGVADRAATWQTRPDNPRYPHDEAPTSDRHPCGDREPVRTT
jgi:hypothetical protein